VKQPVAQGDGGPGKEKRPQPGTGDWLGSPWAETLGSRLKRCPRHVSVWGREKRPLQQAMESGALLDVSGKPGYRAQTQRLFEAVTVSTLLLEATAPSLGSYPRTRRKRRRARLGSFSVALTASYLLIGSLRGKPTNSTLPAANLFLIPDVPVPTSAVPRGSSPFAPQPGGPVTGPDLGTLDPFSPGPRGWTMMVDAAPTRGQR